MTIHKTLKLIILLLFSTSMFSQRFTIEKISQDTEVFVEKPKVSFFELEKALPDNFVKDGSVDYTYYVQKTINEYSNIELPNFPILINDKGIKLKSNSKIYFNKHSALILEPTLKERYALILIDNIQNVSIYNPHLIGDRHQENSRLGEWGMGVRIQDSKHINIYNVNIRNMWGDGIYITSYAEGSTSDIIIKEGHIDNVRRNGVSIISGEYINIFDLLISNTNGTRPSAGITIEPNNSKNYLNKIILKNIYTYNNQRDGIYIHLNELFNPDMTRKIDIIIDNHKDENSRYSFTLSELKDSRDSKPFDGEINITKAIWNSRKEEGYRMPEKRNLLPKVDLKHIKINNKDIYRKVLR